MKIDWLTKKKGFGTVARVNRKGTGNNEKGGAINLKIRIPIKVGLGGKPRLGKGKTVGNSDGKGKE